jgi:hypothetical protein
MSLIRPEARATLWRWREVMVGIVLTALGLYWASGFGLLRALGLALAMLGAVILYAGAQRARVRQRPTTAPGLIVLDERQLSYMAPQGGAIVLLGEVTRIEIETNDLGPYEDDMFWLFHQNGTPPSRIPASALGHERLLDALAAFPGADFEKVIAASGSTTKARFVIWQKPTPKDLPRLH